MKKSLLLFFIAISICTQAESPAALTTLQRVIVLEGKQKINDQHFAQTDSAIVAVINMYEAQRQSNLSVIASQYAQLKEMHTALVSLKNSIKDSVEKYQSVVYLRGNILKTGDTILIR